MVFLGSPGNNSQKYGFRKNFSTGNQISNSYFQRNQEEPVLLHVYLMEVFFYSNYFQKKWFL
jgi:hypothetical protein